MQNEAIRSLLEQGRAAEALPLLLEAVRRTSDYGTHAALCRLRQKIGSASAQEGSAQRLRIALLSGSSTDFLAAPLALELETFGIMSELHRGEFGTYAHEMLEATSETARFRPDVAILLTTHAMIPDWPAVGDSAERVEALVEDVTSRWLGLCESLHAHTNCEIVVGNLHVLPARTMGSLGCRMPWDANTFVRGINASLARRAPAYVHLLDIDTLSAIHGVSNWFDARFWHHSKQPVSFACLVPFVRNLAGVIAAMYGRTAKCIVLDLDNTLWGGVVGDDGVENLRIGEGDAESEAFKTFQEYLRALKQRGIVLAVSSKNEEDNALAPFERLPEMVLKRADFVAFKANWRPKPEALEEIARELNIGLEAIVFVDDNPAERELVRRALPAVRVVELSSDPTDYPRLLDQSGWLETVRLTEEDQRKTEQYVENLQRGSLAAQHADYGAYLASLEQRADLRPFEPDTLDRVTQLINKTNQFNLTTRRMTRSEVEALLGRDDVLTASVRLVDRFGDNGIISAFSGHIEGNVLAIDLWLMSCRVFKRGVEHFLANRMFAKAKDAGVEWVRGEYTPTSKNRIVERFYAELGFAANGTAQDGAASWLLRLDDFRPLPVYISPMEGVGP